MSTRAGQLGSVIACTLFAGLLVRTAWLCDDAYITFRTVENAVAGHG